MDHRWDEGTWQDRASRGERERFGTRRIAHDPDVERRDRLREEERRQAMNQSPWAIGQAFYDQRDLYTRNASIGSEGYGRGPSRHPEEGSYAYRRPRLERRSVTVPVRVTSAAWTATSMSDASRSPRYVSASERDPYFSHLHPTSGGSVWQRLKDKLTGKSPKNWSRADAQIKEDVSDALTYRGDLDASDIEVAVHAAEVTLTGTVTDRRSKRIAEEVAEGVRGVRDVHNRLTIRIDDPTDANVAFVLPLAALGA